MHTHSDMLSTLVQLAQIRGQADVRCLFQGDWQVRHESRPAQALVHMVTAGAGWLKLDGETEARRVVAGDVVFFPRLSGHILSSAVHCGHETAVVESREAGGFTLKTSGSGDADVHLFCARFHYDERAWLPAALPDVLFLQLQNSQLAALASLLQYEAAQVQAGAAAVLDGLCTVLLVALMRAALAQTDTALPEGILKAWQEPRLQAPVQAVLQAPEQDWRVDVLAAAAHVSRAQLMRLFKQYMGMTPHAFVLAARLQKAAMLLRSSQHSVLTVALGCGFASETHFGKAFRQYYGQTPGEYRKAGGAV